MGIFDKVKKTTIEQRRYEEKLYEVALEEVEAGERRKGLPTNWAVSIIYGA